MPTRYFIFAGEPSGDLHGSRFIQALLARTPQADLYGVGGPRMRLERFHSLVDMENFQVMGLTDILMSLPRLVRQFYKVRQLVLRTKPDCLVLIDYPGFNLRLARSLRKIGFQGKIVQYISPTVWAHGSGRIQTLARYYDLVLSIFPFETPYFSETDLNVEYVGNPLVHTVDTHLHQEDWRKNAAVPSSGEFIALFPGSRMGEIKRHVPLQLEAAASIKNKFPSLHLGLSCANDSLYHPLVELSRKSSMQLGKDFYIIPSNYRYELMKNSGLALAKSGTVTLELALHSVPSVVQYELSAMNYLFAKYLLKLNLPHYCIVNILAKKTIFPEFMGYKIPSCDLQIAAEKILSDARYRKETLEGCAEVRRLLGINSASEKAVEAIEELMQC